MSIHPIDNEFDWDADDSVVIPAQPPTAVYSNARGDIVIRQLGEDEETFVFVRPENAQALCRAIMAEAQPEASEPANARAPEPKRLPPPA